MGIIAHVELDNRKTTLIIGLQKFTATLSEISEPKKP